jgi:hypothetical protein
MKHQNLIHETVWVNCWGASLGSSPWLQHLCGSFLLQSRRQVACQTRQPDNQQAQKGIPWSQWRLIGPKPIIQTATKATYMQEQLPRSENSKAVKVLWLVVARGEGHPVGARSFCRLKSKPSPLEHAGVPPAHPYPLKANLCQAASPFPFKSYCSKPKHVTLIQRLTHWIFVKSSVN